MMRCVVGCWFCCVHTCCTSPQQLFPSSTTATTKERTRHPDQAPLGITVATTMVHVTDTSAREPHITARLALQLLEHTVHDSACPSPSSSGSGVPSKTAVQRKTSSLRRALNASTAQATTAAASSHSSGAHPSHATATSLELLMNKANFASAPSTGRAPASTASSTDLSYGSIDDHEVEEFLEDEACEERGRMGATARALSVEHHDPNPQDFSSGIQWQPSFDDR